MSIFHKRNSVPRSVWTDPLEFIACGFGLGAMPWMPGTFGTVLGVVFYLGLNRFSLFIYVLITLLLFIFGVIISEIVNRRFGTVDHPGIIWDEVVGFLIVMIGVPRGWLFIVIGFILFRVFDIWKPWPIRWLEKNIPGGWGVMVDDVMAAIYAAIVLWIVIAIVN